MLRAASYSLMVAALLALGACDSHGSATLLNGAQAASAKPAAQVAVLAAMPKRSFEVIAQVRASAFVNDHFSTPRTKEVVIERLREEAGKIGADAITEVMINLAEGDRPAFDPYTGKQEPSSYGWFGELNMSAKAIRYTDAPLSE